MRPKEFLGKFSIIMSYFNKNIKIKVGKSLTRMINKNKSKKTKKIYNNSNKNN